MRVLITGASGFIGSQAGIRLMKAHELLGLSYTSTKPLPFESLPVDITNTERLHRVLSDFCPEVILHTAALSQVIPCENSPEVADRVNSTATEKIAAWAADKASRLIFISTDQVFDGHDGNYCEQDEPHPVNHYGWTKFRAEQAVQRASSNNLIVRSNSVVGPSAGWGSSFTDRLIESFEAGKTVNLFDDQFRSPIHIRRMVDVLESCVNSELSGFLHAGGVERQSRLETGTVLAKAYGFNLSLIQPGSYLLHNRADIMHPDGSFDTALLKVTFPCIAWRPLELEFRDDASTYYTTSHGISPDK